MKKNINRALSLILTFALVFSLGVPAFATDAGVDNETELTGTVTHVVSGDCVIEMITLFDSDGNSVVIEKKVYANGEMEVFQNNVLLRTETDVNYGMYLAVAEGRYMSGETFANGAKGITATNPCGFDDTHTAYGSPVSYTVDIEGTTNTLNAAADICGFLKHPATAVFLRAVSYSVGRALDGGARYVDVTATDFLIMPEGYDSALICTHVMFAYYDMVGSTKVYKINEWQFYQTYL